MNEGLAVCPSIAVLFTVGKHYIQQQCTLLRPVIEPLNKHMTTGCTVIHTNGATSVRAHKVDLSLGDGTHPDLVEGPGEEGSKGAAEHNVPVTTGQPDSHATDVLLGNEALNVTIREGLLVGEGESGVLGVSIQCHKAIVALPEFDQSVPIYLASSMLGKINRDRVTSTISLQVQVRWLSF